MAACGPLAARVLSSSSEVAALIILLSVLQQITLARRASEEPRWRVGLRYQGGKEACPSSRARRAGGILLHLLSIVHPLSSILNSNPWQGIALSRRGRSC